VAATASKCLYLDTMGLFEPSISSTWYDTKIVDQFLHKSWDGHMKTKDQLYKILCKHLDCLKGKGITMKYIQCDNAGKQGRKLAELCKACGIQMEYTAPNMPQQNGVVEWKIAMDHDHAYTMLLAAHLIKKAWHLLRAKAESMATKLSNLAWNQQVKGVLNDLFNRKPGKLHPGQLIEFGWVGYVTIWKQIKTKWVDSALWWGIPMTTVVTHIICTTPWQIMSKTPATCAGLHGHVWTLQKQWKSLRLLPVSNLQ